jgi:hypothetical protein
VIRFWNDEVFLRIDDVLEAIIAAVDRTPHPNPLPARGERESTGLPRPFAGEGWREGGSK